MLRLIFWLLLLVANTGAHAAASPSARLTITPTTCPTAEVCGADWTWVKVTNPQALAPLDPKWRLLIDQTRFRAIRVEVDGSTGRTVLAKRADDLADNWSLGNNLLFEIPSAGRDVRALRIGFQDLDHPSLMRSVQAMSYPAHAAFKQRWLALIAFVVGVLTCSLVSNLFLLNSHRTPFQRWYVAWVAATLAYSLLWSGSILYAFPQLAGFYSSHLNYLMIGVLVATGTIFFFKLIEPDKLPQRLRRIGFACAAGVMAAGVLAIAQPWVPAWTGDRLLNLAFVICTLCISIGVVFAIRRGSRSVWFYLAGWAPPLIVFELRVARNFGFAPQADLLDMASFVVLAWEAMMLSLAIADRYRSIRRAHDAAEAERQTLRRVANTDALTGLGNRTAFQDRLASLAARRAGADLVVVDLDYLKETNDGAGHDAGDALIVEAGRRLQAAAGPDALVARIGGDEFAVLLEGPARAALSTVLDQVERSANATYQHMDRSLPLSLSAGYASWESGLGDPQALYKNADLALYRAKADGRGRCRAYLASMRAEQDARRNLIAAARSSLARGEFELHYQPVVDMRSGDVIGHEALLRWHHPARGLLAPGEFTALFDDPTLAAAVQAMVLDEAIRRTAALAAGSGTAGRVGVNFVAGQLQGPAAAEAILAKLKAAALPPSALIIEIPETVAIARSGSALVTCLRRLQAAGCTIALDDFGTGYASLVHLRGFPADILKIDRSFIAGLPTDQDSQKIVRAIVALAHGLGKRVVAEGIETEAQRDFLRRLGCDSGQGHLFGRPEQCPTTIAATVAASA